MTHEDLLSMFDYHSDGYFISKTRRNKLKSGSIVSGWLEKGGYRRLYVMRKTYLLHRLIYFYHNGYLPGYPNKELDHIDGDKRNNRIENLRVCNKNENLQNRNKNYNSSSKYKGVSYITRKDRWLSSVEVNKKSYYIGTFKTQEEAAKAYDKFIKVNNFKFCRSNNIK